MDAIVVAIYVLFLIGLFPFMKIIGMNIFRIDIINIAVVSLYVFSFIGTIFLYFHIDEYRYRIGVQDKEIITKVMICSITSIIAFILGSALLRTKYKKYIEVKQEVKGNGLYFLYFLFLICCIVLTYFISKIDKLAILVAIFDGINESKFYRSEMGNNFQGYHWFKMIMHSVGNLLCYFSFAQLLVKNSWKYKVFFALSFSYSAFVAIMATEKAPLGYLFIGLFFTYSLVKKGGVMDIKKILKLTVVVLLFLTAFYISFMGSISPIQALTSVFSRAFTGSIAPAYFYLQFFPNIHEYVPFRTFPNPGGILPIESYRYTVEIMNWRFPSLEEQGIVGTMPTSFWGEAYANFGFYGVIIVPFFIGIYFSFINEFILKNIRTTFDVAFFVWLIMYFKDIAITGFSGFLISIYLFSLILIYLLFNFISNRKIRY